MLFFRKKKKVENQVQETNQVSKDVAYDKAFKTEKLKVMVTIVNKPQGDFFIKQFQENGVACSMLVAGSGTATKEIYEVLGIGEIKKDIVFSLVKESDLPKLKEIVMKRFSVSKKTKGVSFCIEMNSVAGVLIYKYLTNTRVNERKANYGEPKRAKTL